MAGRVTANGSASSVTVASPFASRARISRRVGSASAAKVRSSCSVVILVLNSPVTLLGGKSRDAPTEAAYERSQGNALHLARRCRRSNGALALRVLQRRDGRRRRSRHVHRRHVSPRTRDVRQLRGSVAESGGGG